MTFTLKSNAKINLLLRIKGKRPDGYHNLETIMVPIDLADEMKFTTSPDLVLKCSDPSLPTDSRNLVIRAARLLQENFKTGQGARIELKKEIPVGAGLGGGSSNATFALKGLNRLWNLKLKESELESLAGELGSDTAFFVKNQPALATGRGEKLNALKMAGPIPLLLVHLGFGSSTAWAYGHCGIPRDADSTVPVPPVLTREAIIRLLRNDLQAPVFKKFPVLAAALDFMKKQNGVLGAMMSGSGSTLFAILDSDEAGPGIASALRARFTESAWVWLGAAAAG